MHHLGAAGETRYRGIGIAILAAAAIDAAAAQASDVPRVEIVAFGTYAPTAQHERLPPTYRQDAIVEVTQTDMPRLIARTDRIEAHPCTRFGLEYRAPNLPPNAVEVAQVRVDHPLLTRPDGQRSATDTYDIPLRRSTGWTGFDFDEAWEMLPGTWTFSLRHAGQVLATQRFAILPAPEGARKACTPAIA